MNSKIIGFTISPFEIDHSDIDIFQVGLNLIQLRIFDYFVYLWGIGDLKKCFLDNKISLGFPPRY